MKRSMTKALFVLLALPGAAAAHTGGGETASLLHGLSHPLGGADHLLAMVAVGIWAAQIGGRALWAVPSAFVGVMVLGGAFGFSGLPAPFIETGILASVLILGVLIAGAFRLPLLFSAAVVGFFGVFHGYAHGAEMPATLGAGLYTAGFVLATAALHAAGMALGMVLRHTDLQAVQRLAGGAIAVSGVYLAVA